VSKAPRFKEERGRQAALGSSMATTEPPRSALPAIKEEITEDK
jgi:hypothetical protein